MAALSLPKLLAAALAALVFGSAAGGPAKELKEIEGMKEIVAAIRHAELAGSLPGSGASRNAAEILRAGGQEALLEAERSWAGVARGPAKAKEAGLAEVIAQSRRSEAATGRPAVAAAQRATPPDHVSRTLAGMEAARARIEKGAAGGTTDPEGEKVDEEEKAFLDKIAKIVEAEMTPEQRKKADEALAQDNKLVSPPAKISA
mmetsp:Transcript_138527/g.430803  ORF Transcript_138527/g.430803 Transcript_138527/m.430803 type:complete len:203 (-) Transcript_138527:57-665(-)